MGFLKAAGIIGLCALSGVLWFGLVRQQPVQAASATVLSKSFREGGTYVQHPVGASRGLRAPADIPIAESYAFELRMDGVAEPVRASFNTVKSSRFEVGQRVRLQYVRRGLPGFRQRISVVEMTAAESH